MARPGHSDTRHMYAPLPRASPCVHVATRAHLACKLVIEGLDRIPGPGQDRPHRVQGHTKVPCPDEAQGDGEQHIHALGDLRC